MVEQLEHPSWIMTLVNGKTKLFNIKYKCVCYTKLFFKDKLNKLQNKMKIINYLQCPIKVNNVLNKAFT